MKIKTHNYFITVSYSYSEYENPNIFRLKQSFIVKAIPLDENKALEIAKILIPDGRNIKVESIENDALTLASEEYNEIHTILKEYVRIHNKIKEPEYVSDVRKSRLFKVKKLIEKMKQRMDQFPIAYYFI